METQKSVWLLWRATLVQWEYNMYILNWYLSERKNQKLNWISSVVCNVKKGHHNGEWWELAQSNKLNDDGKWMDKMKLLKQNFCRCGQYQFFFIYSISFSSKKIFKFWSSHMLYTRSFIYGTAVLSMTKKVQYFIDGLDYILAYFSLFQNRLLDCI